MHGIHVPFGAKIKSRVNLQFWQYSPSYHGLQKQWPVDSSQDSVPAILHKWHIKVPVNCSSWGLRFKVVICHFASVLPQSVLDLLGHANDKAELKYCTSRGHNFLDAFWFYPHERLHSHAFWINELNVPLVKKIQFLPSFAMVTKVHSTVIRSQLENVHEY